ncbi:very short patch repair endonuclease [Micromonospora sp. NBC_01813]|uniref:very short patch repair endonuclease n=1 Tax=Micromonospora sp. NBC_01813 TaxID=2975988 RepID=UPI002DD91BD9|nr:very short patch repair endonuclease [Micromonospora sp. NBC_01813]WSA08139.1 very short patch repair endonuclease [Micromonospora sp. NBC_01813]
MTEGLQQSEHRWADKLPSARAWKGRKGRSRQSVVAEQDRAAGGHDRRWVDLGDGRRARASVELKLLPKSRRIRAYLRWSDRGKSPARYLGEVSHATRAENLAEGWRLAWSRELLAVKEPASDTSWASSPAVQTIMRANKGRDTRPERKVRSLLHKAGLRYRVNFRPVPSVRRTADIAFPRLRIAVFIDGCFWHSCPDHHRPSQRNAQFWREKFEGNRVRDRETDRILAEAGWTVIRFWEHEDPAEAAERVAEAIRQLATTRQSA